MRSTDDLVHELHSQADEIAGWPMPALPRLATRGQRRGRPAVLVLASVAAVVVTALIVPRLVADPQQTAPAPALGSPTASATTSALPDQEWQAGDCDHGRLGCDAPVTLTYRGRDYVSVGGGGSVPTHHLQVRSPQIQGFLEQRRGDHWLLVGAVGSGPGSRLTVQIGTAAPIPLPPGRLSLVERPHWAGRLTKVVVRESTRPLPEELLVYLEYGPSSP